ncbi:MAG: PHP domain-containing protein [Phycisphaerales bacterium]|nr:PHP domain-containing protein [Phycisphaerales bacterium]
MATLKTVIHAHTDYSFDSNTPPAALVAAARAQGVDCVAITDHDEIAGALAVRALGGVRVIVGEEVSSQDGHIIGLFLQERIPPGLSAEETCARIHDQGGLVLAPHPFSILCEGSLGPAMERLLPWLHAVEVNNAQNLLPWEEQRARRFAARHGLVSFVGADTHIRGYLAACYQLVREFDGPADFLRALQDARLRPGRFGPSYFAAMGARHVWDKFAGRPLPGFALNTPERSFPPSYTIRPPTPVAP